ncbi:hypothetical protein VZQ01_12480 [Myxococcus faecalis]|uniref:hypothetical protein n=1 Tax=Myxococcus faecalis TaxID=3115646 RepID=UPI003CEC0085
MTRSSTVPHLRLVAAQDEGVPKIPPSKALQIPLFFHHNPRILGFVDMSNMSANPFIQLLTELRPRWVMDLRPLPLLDLGGTNRRWFFDFFEKHSIQYFDVFGRIGPSLRNNAALSSGNAASIISALISKETASRRAPPGPILILLEDIKSTEAAERTLPSGIPPSTGEGWETCIIEAKILPSRNPSQSYSHR